MKKRWKQASVFGALLIPLLIVGVDIAVSARAADGGIQWLSYAEGRQRREAENKKVFLVFNADWCRYCLKMEKETFQDPSVVAYVNRNFVPVSVNSDKEQAIADKFNVQGPAQHLVHFGRWGQDRQPPRFYSRRRDAPDSEIHR
jgi:thioredoxin-related protein